MMPARLSRTLLRTAVAAAFTLALAGCATAPQSPAHDEVNDPLEVPNRFVFAVNEATDVLVLRPAAEVYHTLAPDPVRDAVQRVLENLTAPLYVGNSLLQGDLQNAEDGTGRFLTNTFLGVGGIFDVATAFGIPPYRFEDFGQTLGTWGVAEGPYIVLPLLGPSNARDAAGYAVDTVADPVRIAAYRADVKYLLYVRAGVSAVDARSRVLREVDDLRRNSLDFYAAIRSLNHQRREAAIRNSTVDNKPDFPEYDAPSAKPAK